MKRLAIALGKLGIAWLSMTLCEVRQGTYYSHSTWISRLLAIVLNAFIIWANSDGLAVQCKILVIPRSRSGRPARQFLIRLKGLPFSPAEQIFPVAVI